MIKNPHPGKFITFEGIDFSGKSEQYTRAKNYLGTYFPDLSFGFTKEPTDQPSGKEIYDVLFGRHPVLKLEEMHRYHFQELYFRDRVWNYKNRIIPWLSGGRHVLADRGPVSVVFGANSNDDFAPLMEIQEQVFKASENPFIWPDATLIYDIPIETFVERAKNSGRPPDKFENPDKERTVRENYFAFAKAYPNCYIIDGNRTPQEIFGDTKRIILTVLGLQEDAE